MKEIEGKYLLACSGGPDSMALLEMARRMNVICLVAHVNYHHRPTANRDENIVREYCNSYNLPFVKLDIHRYRGNFQDYARVVRYRFFKKIVKKEKLDGVLVAHHLDDLLETYLLQKKRGSVPDFYGLRESTEIEGINVFRPLLEYTKKELEEYCQSNNIPYGIDESNLLDDYARNRIRHQQIEKMSYTEKQKMKAEIDSLNCKKEVEEQLVIDFLNGQKTIDFECYKKCTFKEILLRYLIDKDISEQYINELIRQLGTAKTLKVKIGKQYLTKEYGKLEVFNIPEGYSITLDEFKTLRRKHFAIRKKGTSLEAVTVTKEDFPLTIRNVQAGDSIALRYGRKKLNRYFIDRKISSHERLITPVIVNRKGQVILVPGIGCDKEHYSPNPNMFCVKIK